MTQRYLVAKFVPDVFRMEPRNIGIILWSDGVVATKFLQSNDAKFIDEIGIYERWTNYWNRLINDRVIANGQSTKIDDPSFLDAMLKKQEGNFRLFDAGRVLDPISADDVQSAADFLFSEMVAPLPEEDAATEPADGLAHGAEELFAEIGLRDRNDWRGAASVKCWVKGVLQEFSFNYVFGTERKTKAVFQRVPISRRQSVNSTAFMMEWVGVTVVKAKVRRAAIIDTSIGDQPTIEQTTAMLKEFATVIDLSNRHEAKRKIIKAVGVETKA